MTILSYFRLCRLLLPLNVGLLLAASLVHAESDASGNSYFESKVRPLLIKRCYECHSAESGNRDGGLTLDQRAGWEQGGDSGPALVPGKPEASLLIGAVRHTDADLAMPPKEKLPESEIAILEEWVRIGAPDPRDGKVIPVTPEIDIEAGRKFWAFQPLAQSAIPAAQLANWFKVLALQTR